MTQACSFETFHHLPNSCSSPLLLLLPPSSPTSWIERGRVQRRERESHAYHPVEKRRQEEDPHGEGGERKKKILHRSLSLSLSLPHSLSSAASLRTSFGQRGARGGKSGRPLFYAARLFFFPRGFSEAVTSAVGGARGRGGKSGESPARAQRELRW